VETIGKPNDEVWIGTASDTHEFDLLAEEWMMRMGDGYKS
jgi:frataxin-like iron-binding protein CyaY